MFSDDDTKELQETSFMRPGDEIISIREVCLSDKFDKKDLVFQGEPLLLNSGKNDPFRDGFFSEGLEPQQASFAWTEEDGSIVSLVSEPGFGTTGHTTFGRDLDAEIKDISSTDSREGLAFGNNSYELQNVSSTSTDLALAGDGSSSNVADKKSKVTRKVDKADPRSRYHYVKYVKRQGRNVKLWECGICSREFQHQYTLMRHLPTHTDERNFHCDTCDKSFRQLSTLSQHRAIHSSERPYTCEVCRKAFNRVSTLISHRKTHSNEKPYKCHMCPKGFHQKGNLRNHLFTHTNERPYRCNICMKGFNQQSNLVCHKNKVHSDVTAQCTSTSPGANPVPAPTVKSKPDTTKSPSCEVSSSVGNPQSGHVPRIESSLSTWCTKAESWDYKSDGDGSWGSGVIVDAINTYHMGVALATKQTPFALLKPDAGSPVLVKVVDTNLPGGKHMLVPATAEDLREGGKIVLNSDDGSPDNQPINGAVQIRVPVVATVVPKIRAGGRLHLVVEEPHHAFHSALPSDVISGEACTSTSHTLPSQLPPLPTVTPRPLHCGYDVIGSRPVPGISSTCALPPPAPSPPLDLIALDLFEPIGCIPLGPQITPVDGDNLVTLPTSDESDFCIGDFQDSIALSDSE